MNFFLDALHVSCFLFLVLELSSCFTHALELMVHPAYLLCIEAKLLSANEVLDTNKLVYKKGNGIFCIEHDLAQAVSEHIVINRCSLLVLL